MTVFSPSRLTVTFSNQTKSMKLRWAMTYEAMSVIGTIREDVTTDVLGKIGSWQWLVTFVSTSHMMLAMFNQYEDMFLLQPSEVYCIVPNEFEIINSSLCLVTFENNGTENYRCNKWHLRFLWVIWLQKTWLVFCDQKLKLLSTAIISRFGLVFGSIIFGLVSDSFGRRTAIILDAIAELSLGLVITFCDSEGWFRLIAFLKSLFGSANFYMGLILICEIASNSWRTLLCFIAMCPRLLALACMVPLANSAPNSETFSFISCIYAFLCLILLRWTPESPQWLLHNRKIHVAEKLLLNAAKRNDIILCNDFKIRPVNHRAYTSLEETATCVGGMLATYNIRILFIVSTLFWILYYFLWSSLYVRLYSEKDVHYLLLKVFCTLAVLGCLTKLSSMKLTLRYMLLVHVLIAGVSSAGATIFYKAFPRLLRSASNQTGCNAADKNNTGPLHLWIHLPIPTNLIGIISSMLSSIALASGLLAHALILNITPRLFAINIRATVVGCCHGTGQLGSIISYLLFLFHPLGDITQTTIELFVTIILAGLCFVFPDVDQRELPDVLRDMDYFSELSKPLRWVTQKTNSPSLEELELRVYSFGSPAHSGSTTSPPVERVPAQQIGCVRLWQVFINYVRRKYSRRINPNIS